MNEKNIKKAGKTLSAKKLRTIPVVCLLISSLFGVIFVASDQVSATDNMWYEPSEFDYDSCYFRLPKVNTYVREYVINQAGTLILPPVSGMLTGGVIGFALGGLIGATAGMAIGGTIGTAVSVAKNMLKFVKSTTDWYSLRSNIDLDSLRSTTDWSSFRSNIDWDSYKSNIDIDSLKRTTNEITMPVLENTFWDSIKNTPTYPTYINPYTGSYPSFDTSDIPKLRTDHIPKINIPDSIPNFNPQ